MQGTRDIVVVGSSAGGIDALPRLLAQLPADLPASVFLCQHIAATEDPQLVHILRRATTLEVRWAEQGALVEPGCVYVAPPDLHLTFADSHMRLSRGPKENYARPSIDRLFRSAAAVYAGRTIGVVLTGMLSDGAAGAAAIRAAGGRVIIQDPLDAAFPELPQTALAAVVPDEKLPLAQIGPAIIAMTRERAPASHAPESVMLESELDQMQIATPRALDELGPRSPVNCPDCGGPLWSVGHLGARRWRCYLGHVTSGGELLERSDAAVESSLWSAVRALHEHAATLEGLAQDAVDLGSNQIAQDYASRAATAREQAGVARQFMENLVKRVH